MDSHNCEKCEKDFDELVTRQGFRTTFYCEFVCEGCFFELEGVTFKEYNASHLYSKDLLEAE